MTAGARSWMSVEVWQAALAKRIHSGIEDTIMMKRRDYTMYPVDIIIRKLVDSYVQII